MQLSRLSIGHAIAESTVVSGSLTKHPVKRTRTTLGYIMISLFGSDHERAVLRSEVNSQHRRVHSDDASVVAYNAFDPELQLWVAACMYRGVLDASTFLDYEFSDAMLDEVLAHCARFATTLQVPLSMWPDDHPAFERYWESSMQRVVVDDVTRDYLLGIASLTFLPRPLARLFGPFHRFLTAGFLPDVFRDALGLAWSPRDQQRFERCATVAAIVNGLLPRSIRELPWNVVEWETRRRIRKSRPIV